MNVGDVPFRTAMELIDHWEDSPPAAESLARLAMAWAGWEPRGKTKRSDPLETMRAVKQIGGDVMDARELPSYIKQATADWLAKNQVVN